LQLVHCGGGNPDNGKELFNMKCPVCNTWVMVKETRARPNNVAYRRYECANEHRFITLEKVERVIEKKEKP
ncbi:MAG: hypothetical protein JZU63_13810, partial [Rhodoferax sp.]|nr:hypothetical protein [Rhodoferax sp.]